MYRTLLDYFLFDATQDLSDTNNSNLLWPFTLDYGTPVCDMMQEVSKFMMIDLSMDRREAGCLISGFMGGASSLSDG